MFQKVGGVASDIWLGSWLGAGADGWNAMVRNWTEWKSFPRIERGEVVEAPIGPGIYEVRDVSSGDLVAFDAAPSVALALSAVWRRPSARLWKWQRLFGKASRSTPSIDLEYRSCPAASFSEAQQLAHWLLERRQLYWQRATGVPSASSAA